MSLEQRIESLEIAIVKLTEVYAAAAANAGAAVDTSAASAGKTTGKSAAAGKGSATSKTTKETKTEQVEQPSKYTLEQLKALLQDFKQLFGMPEAKKLLPGLGYENSNAVPADKVDEVYDHVEGLIKAKSEEEDEGGL